MKKILSLLLVLTMLLTLVGCKKDDKASDDKKGGNDSKTDVVDTDDKDDKDDKKNLEVLGETLKYDPNVPVNNGEPITIDFWTWDFVDIYRNLIDQYQEIHPNVEINLIETPWGDYWTKLPLSLNSKDSPALFAIHNSYHDNLINYMAPYEMSLDDLRADFLNVDSHLIDGEIYYIDYAMMTANLYYNKDMWEAAGLTDEDFPETWEELREVAKKLTIKEGDNLVQAGFNYNGTFNQMILGLNYQLGQNLFNEDGTATINNEAMNDIVKFFIDLYKVDGVGSENFGATAGESFGQGQSAMVVMWGYYYNSLAENYPDIDAEILEIPKFSDEGEIYAYNRYNGESSLGVSKNVSDEAQAVAQDFVRFSFANDEFLVDYSVRANCFPTKISLADNEKVLSSPVLAALAPNIDRYVWPGTMPSTLEDNMKIAGENILFNNMPINEALAEAEAKINNDLANTDFVPVEDMYKYAR